MGFVANLAASAASGLAGLFTRRTTRTDGDGTESEIRKVRPVPASLGGLLIFLVFYHLLLWPWLNHHFPEYDFPPLDFSLLSLLAGIGL